MSTLKCYMELKTITIEFKYTTKFSKNMLTLEV